MWRGGVKSFVDDLVLGRGVVISRAATSLRSVETQPLTRRFVRSQTSNISAMVISGLRSPGRHHPFSLTEAEKGCEALGSLYLRTQTAVYRSNDRVDSCCLHIVQPPTSPSRAWWVVDFKCLLYLVSGSSPSARESEAYWFDPSRVQAIVRYGTYTTLE